MAEVNEEAEQVEQPEPVEPVEPTEPVEPEPEPEPEPVEPEPEPQARQPRDDVEADEIFAKLGTRATNYFKSVGSMLEGIEMPPVNTLCACEMCADAYPGLRWLEPRRDEVGRALEAWHGQRMLEDLKQAEWTRRCGDCEGRGWVKTDSLVAGNEAIPCKVCNASGYIVIDLASGQVISPVAPTGNGDVEPVAGVNPDDPAVVELKRRGFTVIPPMAVVS